MANGGIYDQLGGGFHRYSVDAIWLVPHFEKMLYDNAQLVRVYLHTFQVTGEMNFTNGSRSKPSNMSNGKCLMRAAVSIRHRMPTARASKGSFSSGRLKRSNGSRRTRTQAF